MDSKWKAFFVSHVYRGAGECFCNWLQGKIGLILEGQTGFKMNSVIDYGEKIGLILEGQMGRAEGFLFVWIGQSLVKYTAAGGVQRDLCLLR